jgi:transcription-repair coupling factor (superfamily II helicase)
VGLFGLLLKLVTIKAHCRKANVEKLEAGPKGLTLALRKKSFANPTALAKWVAAQGDRARVRRDMRIVVTDDFERLADRLDGTLKIMREIAKIATKSPLSQRERGAGVRGPLSPVREGS